MQESSLNSANPREQIIAALNDLDHILPGQAPIIDFVHHNTLHGFQHLPFEDALAAFTTLTGISAYLPEIQSRLFYQQGRINDNDLTAALAKCPDLKTEQIVCTLKNHVITQKDIYCIALLFDLTGISVSQLNWQIEELEALNTVQMGVPEPIRSRLFADDGHQDAVIKTLWESILSKLDLQQATLHPEALLDLSLEHAEEWLIAYQGLQNPLETLHRNDFTALDQLLSQVGDSITLRGFILALSGVDILDDVHPQLIRICASAMDEGVASWHTPERRHLGLYAAWRATVIYDANPFLHELPDWQQIMSELPEDAVDTIILQLTQLEIPPIQWAGYLRRLALELPGWSGLINWRQHHPNYQAVNDASPQLADYLAIRLTLDRLWLNQVCRDTWKCAAKISTLRAYFRKNLSEFTVRQSVYQGDLPEYLTQRAEALLIQTDPDRHNRADWQQLADLIWTWQCSPIAENSTQHTLHNSCWRLFRLCQHLGLNATDIEALQETDLLAMLALLDEFTITQRSKIWLYAYENNYRESFFQALRANHHRGRWAKRESRPDAQLIFCMDDREEAFRRHLEEFNPAIETLGTAGFFGIAMNYKGLDDRKVTPLCPVVVTPAHEVQEVPRIGNDKALACHNRGRKLNQWLANCLHHGLRRNLLLSHPIIDAIAPLALLALLAKSLLPKTQYGLLASMAQRISPPVKTQLNFTSTDNIAVASSDQPKSGFTDGEQADRVAGLLRNTGLTYEFSELIVLMGHGSISQNNPHLAAYDCGACSGRHGGPNGRVFAAMANRPEIRKLLLDRGITIPSDTWFIGAEHNTCNETIIWYDLADVPPEQLASLSKLQEALRHAQQMSAHERCRRLASAPRQPTPKEALAHIKERATDFSQTRPELGHATNASAVVGRRSLTQGVFFDRRVFLISYDPTQDTDGKLLEGILLAVGPVGAGINLEYYFSTVNNERLGCGSKVPHNVTGFFGVMEGASSDLRTGLPQQMIEIHEAMRLQLLVEAKTSVLERIYADQKDLRELIGGGWIHLSAKDPDSGEIFIFEPNTGFVRWQAEVKALALYDKSEDCYRDQTLPVPPALIKQPLRQAQDRSKLSGS
ncbi:DUF2309 domain-containing protein [Methylobacter psychrophilus]|uniref:DUF2309 domain-containing protein n=1 Tax=Methylobacter psychrophilus TaxID=96941 RepID=UPI0021D5182E|nr:DUF2309 domain-containing protein [Methylobacter psychrophilus]